MAIENELKYVLYVDEAFEKQLKALSGEPYEQQHIAQDYINLDTRIRHFTSDCQSEHYIFSFKKRLKNGESFELEKPISKEEYEMLLPMSVTSLVKDRIKIQDGDMHWDIDLYKNALTGKTYFALAEVEMPEGQLHPDRILPLLRKNIILKVDRDDKRFTARKLADEKYAKKAIKELTIEFAAKVKKAQKVRGINDNMEVPRTSLKKKEASPEEKTMNTWGEEEIMWDSWGVKPSAI